MCGGTAVEGNRTIQSNCEAVVGHGYGFHRMSFNHQRCTGNGCPATERRQPGTIMTVTFLLGGLLALVILIRQVRWLAVIALVVAIGYFAHNRLDYWPHEERRDHMKILRP